MRGSIMAGIKWTFTALAVAGAIALVGCNDHSASGADGEATGGETTGGATTGGAVPRDRDAEDGRPERERCRCGDADDRSEEHTSELQSLMRISYAVFCLQTKNKTIKHNMN